MLPEKIDEKFCAFAMMTLYPKEVVIHYISDDELALSYLFNSEEEAGKAYRFCVDLIKEVENFPSDKREAAHRHWIKAYMKKIGCPTVIY